MRQIVKLGLTCKINSEWEPAIKHRQLAWCSVMTQREEMRVQGGVGREVQEGRDVCIHMTDSRHCSAETNTAL